MAEKQYDKFIVLNRKRLEELVQAKREVGFSMSGARLEVRKLNDALADLMDAYDKYVLIPADHQYIVCNQDEPYAEKVWEIILAGEDAKTVE